MSDRPTTCGRCYPGPRCTCQDENNARARIAAMMPKIVVSDAVPPDTIFAITPSPVDDPEHPDYVPIEKRAGKIRIDPEE